MIKQISKNTASFLIALLLAKRGSRKTLQQLGFLDLDGFEGGREDLLISSTHPLFGSEHLRLRNEGSRSRIVRSLYKSKCLALPWSYRTNRRKSIGPRPTLTNPIVDNGIPESSDERYFPLVQITARLSERRSVQEKALGCGYRKRRNCPSCWLSLSATHVQDLQRGKTSTF